MKPCRRGHTSGRYADGHCKECHRKTNRASYHKEDSERRERRRQSTEDWRLLQPERWKASKRHNNSKRRAAGRFPLTEEQAQQMRDFYAACPPGHHVDHIYPLNGVNSCGLHVPWNLQYLPELDNLRKGNRVP